MSTAGSVEPRVDWTDVARKRISPRRVEDLPELKRSKPATLWKAVLKNTRIDAFKRMVDETEGCLRPHADYAIGLTETKSAPDVDDDRDRWAVVLRVLGHPNRGGQIVSFLQGATDLERAVAIWARATSFKAEQVRIDKQWGYVVRQSPTPTGVPGALGLRWALLRAPAEERNRCRALIKPCFEAGTSDLQAQIVNMFPDDQELASALAHEFLNGTTRAWTVVPAIYGALTDVELLREVAAKAGPATGEMMSLLDGVGLDALPIVLELADKATRQWELEPLARTLSIVRSEDVAQFFGKNFGKIKVRKIANDYFPRYPELVDSLRPYGDKKGRGAKMVRDLVARLERAAAPGLSAEEAAEEELPPVLVSPPWRSKKKKRKAIVIANPLLLEGPVAHHGKHDNQMRKIPPRNYTPMTPEQVEDWKRRVGEAKANDSYRTRVGLVLDNPTRTLVPADVRLEVWNSGVWPYREYPAAVYHLLVEAGLGALPGITAWARRVFGGANIWVIGPLRKMEAPSLAPAFAIGLRRRPTSAACREWFRSYPEAAIAGLLPEAVGKTGRFRTACELALRWLAQEGREAQIRERSRELGAEGEAAIDEVLGWDPLLDCPDKPPKLPDQYMPEMLPRPLLKNGKALGLESLQVIGEMLKFSPPEESYAGLVQVREACDERSIAEFAWTLAESWEHAGADKRNRFMCYSLIHFSDDEVVRRTTPALKNGLIVDVLRHIGTDAAQIELATVVARSLKRGSIYHSARTRAERALDEIADEQGLSRDDLDDRLTPILGLDERGGLTLDLGSRVYKVGFDEQLSPEVIDDKGNHRKMFPRGSKKDDPEKLSVAKLAWAELKEDVESIAILRIEALERAMLGHRSWSVDDFRTYWAEHRLMLHLARRMVWAATYEGGETKTFRVSEDGSLADAEDEPFELGAATGVTVPHVLDWPDPTLETWREAFADYELIQPFEQLSRTEPVVTNDELGNHQIVRHGKPEGWDLLNRRLAALGWRTQAGRHSRSTSANTEVRLQRRHIYDKGKISKQMFTLQHFSTEKNENVPFGDADRTQLKYILDSLGVPLPD